MDMIFTHRVHQTVTKMWGTQTPVHMGDGIKFRVTKARGISYVYVKYKSGFDVYDIEFAKVVESVYTPVHLIEDVPGADIVKTISRKLFGFDAAANNLQPAVGAEGTPKASLEPVTA